MPGARVSQFADDLGMTRDQAMGIMRAAQENTGPGYQMAQQFHEGGPVYTEAPQPIMSLPGFDPSMPGTNQQDQAKYKQSLQGTVPVPEQQPIEQNFQPQMPMVPPQFDAMPYRPMYRPPMMGFGNYFSQFMQPPMMSMPMMGIGSLFGGFM